jgi:hypothetical protein
MVNAMPLTQPAELIEELAKYVAKDGIDSYLSRTAVGKENGDLRVRALNQKYGLLQAVLQAAAEANKEQGAVDNLPLEGEDNELENVENIETGGR